MTNKEIEGAEYGLDSRYSSSKERKEDGKALMEARLERMKNLSNDQIVNAKLLQLNLRMESFIKNPVNGEGNAFTGFLKFYIDSTYDKRGDFAKDIGITAIRLSQVLNLHREPSEKFMLRLMVHSEKTYKDICRFKVETWYQIYYQGKIWETILNQDKWRPLVEKRVNIRRNGNGQVA